jgi:hypothetical protein
VPLHLITLRNCHAVWPSTIQVVGNLAVALGEDYLLPCEYLIVLEALAPYNQFPPSLKILKHVVPRDRKMTTHLAGGMLAREDPRTPQVLTGRLKPRESLFDAFPVRPKAMGAPAHHLFMGQ